MKNLIYILFILFTMGMIKTTFAQTCDITLDDLLSIDSKQSFERVCIENNFEKTEIFNGDDGSIVALYGFKINKDDKKGEKALIWASFSNESTKWKFQDNDVFGWDSWYDEIFSEVKDKCSFLKVESFGESSASVYKCSNTKYVGTIGFFIDDGAGFIFSTEISKELREGNDNQAGDKGKVTGDPNASGYYGNGGSGSGENYILLDRKPLSMPKPTYDCNEEGKVYVSISVDQSGKVISAEAGITGTTNSAPCLMSRAKEAALKTKFNTDTNAPTKQVGTLIYNFSLSK